MNVLIVEPMKKPYLKYINSGLKSLQNEVGGYIEAIYPFQDYVGIVCKEDGKLDGLPFNRAIYNEDGELIEIIAGPFLLAGLGDDGFTSLPNELADKYSKIFELPEEFYSVNGEIHVKKIEPVYEPMSEEALLEEFLAVKNCAQDMGNGALARAFHERKIGDYITEKIKKHGIKRFELVLATTISNALWDGRYSSSVKRWAAEVEPFPQPPYCMKMPPRLNAICLNEHPEIINELAKRHLGNEKQKQAYKEDPTR